jgi:hypothetical protein
VVVVVVVNEVVDRNFFDHREHLDGDFALVVVALVIGFIGSYLVGRLKGGERLRASPVNRATRAIIRPPSLGTPDASLRGSGDIPEHWRMAVFHPPAA